MKIVYKLIVLLFFSYPLPVTMAVRYELCIGLNKGHKTTKVKNVKYTGDKKVKGLRGSRLKNVSTPKWNTPDEVGDLFTISNLLLSITDSNPPHQVHPRFGTRGGWSCSLREAHHGIAEGVQG